MLYSDDKKAINKIKKLVTKEMRENIDKSLMHKTKGHHFPKGLEYNATVNANFKLTDKMLEHYKQQRQLPITITITYNPDGPYAPDIHIHLKHPTTKKNPHTPPYRNPKRVTTTDLLVIEKIRELGGFTMTKDHKKLRMSYSTYYKRLKRLHELGKVEKIGKSPAIYSLRH